MTEHEHHWKLWNSYVQLFNAEVGHVEIKREYRCECGAIEYRNPSQKQLKSIGAM